MSAIIHLILLLQILHLTQGCVFTNYVHVKRFRIRGAVQCLAIGNKANFQRIQLKIEFPSGNKFILDEAETDPSDGSFSLFGICMIPSKLANQKLKLFLEFDEEPYQKPRTDRKIVLSFKDLLTNLALYGYSCTLTGEKRVIYFEDDVEYSSNNGILNIFNIYILNNEIFDVFGKIDKLTGLLIANDEGRSGSSFQLESFKNKLIKVAGAKVSIR
uniref:Uncharacterized protein n=1 Tax=Parastrongyloides trichosuri TaxID=131310 RepID=A0A0N4ZF17_PARTI